MGDLKMNHLEFAASESFSSRSERDWERFVARCEKILGHNLDGDDSLEAKASGTSDGYSIDGAYACWEEGLTAQEYVAEVIEEKQRIAASNYGHA